jgi:hypothetical protein
MDARQAALVEVGHIIERQPHDDGVCLEGTPNGYPENGRQTDRPGGSPDPSPQATSRLHPM